ncbi:aconitase [Paenibacillus polysaccharolyticus]|uniref:Aconitate hydratase n=1 Tax=Paenibacillus polysaccharolyticus TaxID=582692 RepID=A0A1G5E3P1_9BACL|nr:aconitate hydratase AcnA [Paenibacillus polysaccharolyticus]SCY21400.1 aconitase [Paenibacillus polysaccharolyticus]
MKINDCLNMLEEVIFDGEPYYLWSLSKLEEHIGVDFSLLPYSLRLLVEAQLRTIDSDSIELMEKNVIEMILSKSTNEIKFKPSRAIMQDYTGVPALNDLAAIRSAVQEMGGDASQVNPVIPTVVITDHSIINEVAGSRDSFNLNTELEYKLNWERFSFLKWAEYAFENVKVFPPGSGIIHQINLEHLATVLRVEESEEGKKFMYPDSVVGTDSHTTMINGLGLLGWGVGGIELLSSLLGEPLSMNMPQIVGFSLTGRLNAGVTTTDLVLMITEILRKEDVVGKIVEFVGNGLEVLSVAERATIANMAPEYGAMVAYFPIDEETLRYLRSTGRPQHLIKLVKSYYQHQKLFRSNVSKTPQFDKLIYLDLAIVTASLAGPAMPHQRVDLQNLKESFHNWLHSKNSNAYNSLLSKNDSQINELTHGSIVIASITSCTNTSNPLVMIAAGLVARNAVKRGLSIPPYIKTSFSPGSKVVKQYLQESNLLIELEKLGFYIDGFGCMTCSGSSGALSEEVTRVIEENDLIVCSILSGNRNFESRIHPLVHANYLASPPLVIAYAIAGTVNIDLTTTPLGKDSDGNLVFLLDIWPLDEEINTIVESCIQPTMYLTQYDQSIVEERWDSITIIEDQLFNWDKESTYLKKPPYFEGFYFDEPLQTSINSARALVVLGDSITTDHISPGGAIARTSIAGKYLEQSGVHEKKYNSFGARRGNHEVMVRGAFSNPRLKNLITPEIDGGYTKYFTDNQYIPIYEAAMKYKIDQTQLVIIAGEEYGSGSSRDWAAKAPYLLGVKAVIAKSFERIHRSNLVCMGILPLEFDSNDNKIIEGNELITIRGVEDFYPSKYIMAELIRENGDKEEISLKVRIESDEELRYFQNGGILKYLLRNILIGQNIIVECR